MSEVFLCYYEIMKKIICALMSVLLCAGCAGHTEETNEPDVSGKENNMNIALDMQYGGVRLVFDMPDGARQAALSACRPDHSPFKVSTEITTDYDAYLVGDLTAYTAYANDYYGEMCIHVRYLDEAGKKISEGFSEVFKASDYYPPEETRSVKGRSPRIFSYTSESTMMQKTGTDMIEACSVIFDEDGASFSATWFDFRSNRKEIEKQLSDEQTAKLKELIESGELIRKKPSDPAIIMLDGTTPERYQCTFTDSSRAEENWYLFEAEKSRQEELMAFLKSLCH